MKIAWPDGVDYVYVNDRRDNATATIDNVEIVDAPVVVNVKRDDVRVDVYAPAGTSVMAAAQVASWALSHIAALPFGGSFREALPDGIETVSPLKGDA